MKKRIIAINAICKNEIQRIEIWLKAVLTADYICILDTGSTDGTWEYLQDFAARYPEKCRFERKEIHPWRFDVARNEAMKLVPSDAEIYWSLDIDECPLYKWREMVENEWEDGLDVLNYKFSYDSQGTSIIWQDKIRSAVGNWKWVYPVHEKCTFIAQREMKAKYSSSADVWVVHYQQTSKQASAYLQLLRRRAEDDRYNPFVISDMLNELSTRGYFAELVDTTEKWLIPLLKDKEKCNCTDVERRELMQDACLRTANAYRSMDRHAPKIEIFYHLAIEADPTILSSYTNMADWLIEDRNNPYQAIEVIKTAMKSSISKYDIKGAVKDWRYAVWDLLARGYYKIGAYEEALFCSSKALLSITNDHSEYWRIKNNYELVLNADNAWKKMMTSWDVKNSAN